MDRNADWAVVGCEGGMTIETREAAETVVKVLWQTWEFEAHVAAVEGGWAVVVEEPLDDAADRGRVDAIITLVRRHGAERVEALIAPVAVAA